MGDNEGIIVLNDVLSGHECHIVSGERTSDLATRFPHTTFCLIAPYGVSQFLSSNKSNTTFTVVLLLILYQQYAQFGRAHALSLFKEARNVFARFDRFHDLKTVLDGQALAPLGATASQYSTATLARHARAETMAFCTFTGVRLVSALHLIYPFYQNNSHPKPFPDGSGCNFMAEEQPLDYITARHSVNKYLVLQNLHTTVRYLELKPQQPVFRFSRSSIYKFF